MSVFCIAIAIMLLLIAMTKLSFIDWLKSEAEKRDIKQMDIVRAGKISSTHVSRVFSMQTTPSADFMLAVSRAFNLPAEMIYRKAGWLPPKKEDDPLTDEGKYILDALQGTEFQQENVNYLRYRLKVAEEKAKYKTD
jgi:transcriptional regulator with XRE-family HTH domain